MNGFGKILYISLGRPPVILIFCKQASHLPLFVVFAFSKEYIVCGNIIRVLRQ